ncbi:MAG: hypothetical protein WC824_10010, partial [Bacteroidota bacterium]
MKKICPTCKRPEASAEDWDDFASLENSKLEPDEYRPEICWLFNDVNCLSTALDVERTALAMLRAVLVTEGLTRSEGESWTDLQLRVDNLIQES